MNRQNQDSITRRSDDKLLPFSWQEKARKPLARKEQIVHANRPTCNHSISPLPATESSVPTMILIRNRSDTAMVDDSSESASNRSKSKRSARRRIQKRMSLLRDEALDEEGEILPLSELASQFLDFAVVCGHEERKVAPVKEAL